MAKGLPSPRICDRKQAGGDLVLLDTPHPSRPEIYGSSRQTQRFGAGSNKQFTEIYVARNLHMLIATKQRDGRLNGWNG
uniref:HDC17704 n=1 Tax=Drosophila melanogaster TaxID=7227 RepID=Q6IIL2_DROME|nr:TPA_inf: HDC17704 [Drosophila melanogaster]